MKFRDKVERDPEEYGYLILTQRELENLSKKKKDNTEYKKSLEYVKEFTQLPVAYLYKVKLKDLDIQEGFYDANLNYVCMRIE